MAMPDGASVGNDLLNDCLVNKAWKSELFLLAQSRIITLINPTR